MNNKLISVIGGLCLLAGCDSTNQVGGIEALPDSLKNTYAYKPMVNSWPNVGESDLSLDNNLLASNYYLVLDGSGSMKESRCSGSRTKMYQAKLAVSAFAQQIPSDANIGLYVFDNAGSNERVSLASNNQNQVVNAISAVAANDGTPLRSAITHGFNALEEQAKKQLGYGEYHLVIITDGEANRNEEPDSIVDKILESSPVIVHTIGFCIGGGHSLNQPGRIDYKQANDPASLTKGLQEVLAESASFQLDEFEG
jgi:hypothetical protein